MSDDGLRMVRLLCVLFDVLKNYDAAIENLSEVQKRCTELEKERRVLSKALDMAVHILPLFPTGDIAEKEARIRLIERATEELSR